MMPISVNSRKVRFKQILQWNNIKKCHKWAAINGISKFSFLKNPHNKMCNWASLRKLKLLEDVRKWKTK